MLDVQLSELLGDAPEGVDQALDLVAGFDGALTLGLARLGEEPAAALAALAGALAGSPLGDRVGEAVEKVAAGSVADEHLAALAGGRAALFGAVHDALLARLDGALGRTRAAWQPAESEPEVAENLLAGCRVWLRELAIVGWRGVDHDLVSSADQTIEALLAVPELRGLAVLLDGLAAELRASSPVATMERLPARRWADLWTRAMLLAQHGPWHGGGAEPVSGRMLILGADVHEHATVVRVQIHAVLEPAGGGPARLVRTSMAAAKVDTIVGPTVWKLLRDQPVLLSALAQHRSVEITDMPLLPGGDLVWENHRARAGDDADPFATARLQLAAATPPAVTPLDRHPVRIAEPVFVEAYKCDGQTIDLGGNKLALDLDRLPSAGPLTPGLVKASTACIGLVRWDGGQWMLQPLAVQAAVKKQPVAAHNGDWALGPTDPKVAKAETKNGDVVAVLRERAGRLLRK
ncbi:hypothetical protein [Nonomuraea gerenzanensis]|uniref:Uncharacterized protein n=1 Tax=Nonomuraea gerenzanensis TaxID=93944 RepID=A0A1M4E4J1_9ACTN|nr:hypothetical protein [Nonomuraea gerenzanensis]UBU15961.1 hypothetical protein LCN96_13410 [Nonomuraea gerenzanensis]SBO93759.1 FIG01135707: hypothetical protein [Nonomuraea gerenzanensis]